IRLRKAFYNSSEEYWRHPVSTEKLPLRNQENREAGLVLACQYCARLSGQVQHDAVCVVEEGLKTKSFMPKPSMMMSWQQIKMLKDQGHIVGSHTVTHPNMALVEHKELYSELLDSKKVLEEKLQVPVVHFSYPSPMLEPHWTSSTVLVTAEVGYKTATTCTPGNVTTADNPLALRRMWVPFDMDEFIWYLENTLVGRLL
ncbi:MAG: polysaccharide deacetylase family protein, partial [Desulfobulbaceae bacterium]|nr:polysaccharide deacetylase family protein [Desulfobulbaceae bacterium]